MGCTICRKKEEPDVEINEVDQDGYKDLFYATNEFDLSRSESEDEEEENCVLNSMQNTQQQLIENVISPSNELNSTNNTSSTIINDEIVQTDVS
jgi:hypothetical protein